MSVNQMAEYLECNRNTITNYLNRNSRPSPAKVHVWAKITGVPYEWLRDGTWPDEDMWPVEDEAVTNDDRADLPGAEWLPETAERLREISAAYQQISAAHTHISAALQQIADQL
jgi:transcriptional regulator with XRE-family HTH domain